MNDRAGTAFLQWALPRLRLRWEGFRKVRRQVFRRLDARLRELGLDLDGYRRRLQADLAEAAALAELSRITISRFYRDRGVFDALRSAVLPALAAARPDLRAWSAGCASGEEPYSLRLLWDLDLARRFPAARLEIVATDIDPVLLQRARDALYRTGSLRELPADWRREAFDIRTGDARLREPFRRGVAFLRQDLRSESPDGRFDLVLCRNLAFTYFDAALQRNVLARLRRRLRPGGALVLGVHESLPPDSGGFAPWPGARAVFSLR